MLTRKDIEKEENFILAPYATKSKDTQGRAHKEREHNYRPIYQRDKDRIVYSTAFRRLEYKTQVFVNHEGDHYRTRLTHTLEVTQIAKTIARTLKLNSELVEAVALAHDLGHTPFGHSGEDALRELMADHGGFDHNSQGLRVVDLLEKIYPDFSGLNLTYEVREGIMARRAGTMTDRERVEALLNRRKPDRVPVWPGYKEGFSVVYANRPIVDAYNKPEVALAAQRKACQDFGWVFAPMLSYASMGAWEFGGDIKWPISEFDQAPSIARYPVYTEEDVWNLKLPDVKDSGIFPIMMEFCRMSSQERLDNEPFNVLCLVEGPFTIAGNISGPDKLARWLLKEPKVAHCLLRLAMDYLLTVFQYWKDTFGIEGVLPLVCEPTSANQIISPKQFEQFALPYLKETHEKMLAMGYKHIWCLLSGEHNANLPYWAQVPMGDPGFVNIPHEIDLETAAKYFPNDVIVGNLEPAIIQAGTPEEVYEASRKIIEKGKKIPGGYIFAPGDELPPLAPPDNVMAMTKAVRDFGWYE